MILVLKRGASQKEIEAIEKKLSHHHTSGFDADKYNGILKIKGDALLIQKKIKKCVGKRYLPALN